MYTCKQGYVVRVYRDSLTHRGIYGYVSVARACIDAYMNMCDSYVYGHNLRVPDNQLYSIIYTYVFIHTFYINTYIHVVYIRICTHGACV